MILRYKEEQLNLFIHLNPYLSKIILNIDKSVKVIPNLQSFISTGKEQLIKTL